MAASTVTIELPEELVAACGSLAAAAERARRTLALDLLREGRLSQGKAAQLLGVTRWDIVDLMAEYNVPSGPRTPEEVDEELGHFRDDLGDARARR